MAIVIRLDKQALLELIELGGEEFKLELMRGVLAEATKNILKTFAEKTFTEELETARQVIRGQEVSDAIGEQIGKVEKQGWRDYKITLSPKVKQQVDIQIERAVNNEMRRIERRYDAKLKELQESYLKYWAERVEGWLERVAWKKIQIEFEQQVQARLLQKMPEA